MRSTFGFLSGDRSRLQPAAAAVLLAGLLSLATPAVARAQGEMGGPGGEPAIALGNGQRVSGTVTAVAADHLVVKGEDGVSYTVFVTANTRLSKDRGPIKISDVKVGDGAGAFGPLDAAAGDPKATNPKAIHAIGVVILDAEQVKKLREDLGKTYIVGKLTAVDEAKLTILRTDGVSQVIQCDEGTSLKHSNRPVGGVQGLGGGFGEGGGGGRQGGQGQGRPGSGQGGPPPAESITLADVKVGQMVGGKGALKNGVFVPTELTFADPGAGRRRRAEGGAAPATPPAGPQ